MYFKIILVPLIFCLLSTVSVLSQRCTKEITETISYMLPHTVIEKYWDKNWLGMWGQYTRYATETRKEYFRKTRMEYVCCTGYTDVNDDCLPICAPDCPPNSKCTHPFTCTCNEGYRKLSNGSCVPVCLRKCPQNAICVHPNECECATGYIMVQPPKQELQYCEPQCSAGCPGNSYCASPEQCVCNSGYRKHVKGNCEPICSTPCSTNAHCIAPNACNCSEGYKFSINGGECVPECKYDCPLNMYCQSPNKCACRTGYASHTEKMKNKNATTVLSIEECSPVCNADCPAHSECVAPEECRCQMGYAIQFVDNGEPGQGSSICEPICEKPCPQNAICVRPNVCECVTGYEMMRLPQHLDYCQAQCSQNCNVNGKCVAPDNCECFPGFEPMNSTITITDNEVVEAPYCQPVCSSGCPHGDCREPDMCVCHPGYLMGPNGICEPTCSNGCQNGQCIEPEICACSEGYKLSKTDLSKCEPICSERCINADCAAPEFCVCHDKYKPKFNGVFTNECEPICSPECVNAECAAPDHCRCIEGYVPQKEKLKTHICLPHTITSTISPPTSDVSSTDTIPTTTSLFSTGNNKEVSTTETPSVKVFKTFTDAYEVILKPNNLENCKDICYCWKAHLADKCWEICDLENIACLDPKYSYCNETDNRHIVYTVEGVSKVYSCHLDARSMNYSRAGALKIRLQMVIGAFSIAILLAANASFFLGIW